MSNDPLSEVLEVVAKYRAACKETNAARDEMRRLRNEWRDAEEKFSQLSKVQDALGVTLMDLASQSDITFNNGTITIASVSTDLEAKMIQVPTENR